MDCPLCIASNEQVVWEDRRCRVIQVDDEAHPGFCRVIWNEHVAEMGDLLQPDKMNLASLGNMVPHLHWHVIPRYTDDRHFPEPVWGQAQRPGVAHPAADAVALARAIDGALSAGH